MHTRLACSLWRITHIKTTSLSTVIAPRSFWSGHGHMQRTRASSKLAKAPTTGVPALAASDDDVGPTTTAGPVNPAAANTGASAGALLAAAMPAVAAATTAGAAGMRKTSRRSAGAGADSQEPAVAAAALDNEISLVRSRRRRNQTTAAEPATHSKGSTKSGADGPSSAAIATSSAAATPPAKLKVDQPVSPAANKRRRRSTQTGAAGAATPSDGQVAAAVMPPAAAAAADGAATADATPVLVDLGQVVVGELIKRPSATVKTPYVADVKLPDGSLVLAHCPSLDCAGMIVPGCRVHMTENAPRTDKQQAIKTTHAIQLAEDPREDNQSALVGAHPYLAEKIADAAVQQHLLPLPQHLQGYTSVLKQQTLGTGRFDFVLCYEDGRRLLLEVKNAVCADFPVGRVPAVRGKNGVYLNHSEPYTRTALFPIGTGKKPIGVVSDRAIKHLHELTQWQRAGKDDQGRAVQCAVLFVVNRGGCEAFRPCHEADMMFARMLHRAQQCGVLVMAHDVCWQEGQATWGRQLPVVYDPSVSSVDVDEQRLAEVLEFNATNPRTHWKKAKQKQKEEEQ